MTSALAAIFLVLGLVCLPVAAQESASGPASAAQEVAPEDLLAPDKPNTDLTQRCRHTYLIPSVVLGRFLDEKMNLNLTTTLDVPVDRYTAPRVNNLNCK